MKSLQQHISEKLVINKNFDVYNEFPKNSDELYDIVEQRIKENTEEPYLSDIDTSKIDDMSALFAGEDVVKVDLSNWDVSNVKDMGSMFSVCKKLEYVDLTGWKTTSLENMLSMFWKCKNLKEIKGIKDFDITLLKDSDYFKSDEDDTFLDVPEELIPSWWHEY